MSPETDIGSADKSALKTTVTDYAVETISIEGAADQKETTWMNSSWTQYLGYYKTIPELHTAINAVATWTVGKGFTADKFTTFVLDGIRGWGKDTFNTILENMIRVYHIGGDSYAEIIRDKEGNLINLKPLDPAVMKHVANRQGQIIRFEQLSKIKGSKSKKFKPEDIFYLARNRVADEIHGVSIIAAIENIILMRNEAMSDWKQVLHRNVAPLWIFHLDTDDTTKIAEFKATMDDARKDGENMFIPKGAVVPELVATAQNASLTPLAWIEALNQYFFQATGVPDIIVGGGASKSLTEASAKTAYLAWQQTVEEEQLFIEEQVGMQLGLKINLEFPASLEQELLSDKAKDVTTGVTKPNDMIVEEEGRK